MTNNRGTGERGMAMIATVLCLLVVSTLTTVGLQQSLGSISSGAQTRKLQQTVDAAEAGLQSELNLIGAVAAGNAPSGIPCTETHQTVTLSPIDGLSTYYTTTLTPESGPVPLPVSNPQACDSDTPYTQQTIALNPYVLITSTGTSSDPTAGGSGFGRVLEDLVKVTNESPASTSYTENSSAQAADINVLNGLGAVATQQVVANSSNTGSPQTVSSTQLLSGQSVLTAGVLAASAETLTGGTSFACAGALSPGGALQVGNVSLPCSITGTGTGGVSVDLGSLVTALPVGVADVTLTMDAATAGASDTATSAPTGSGTVADVKVVIKLTTLVSITLPVSVAGGPNHALLTDVVSAITGSSNILLVPLATALSNALRGAITLTSNYQSPATPTVGGSLTVSALHIGIVNNAALSADVGMVTVGPNTSSTTPAAPGKVTVTQTAQAG